MVSWSGRIFYLPPEEETDRPGLGYVRGGRQALAVDCGNSPAHAALFFRELKSLGLPRPDFAAVTHWYWDHCYGIGAFECLVAVCEKTQQKLLEMQGWAWTEAAVEKRVAAPTVRTALWC